MQHNAPPLSRNRMIVLGGAALALVLVALAIALTSQRRSAGALPAQRFTTRPRSSTESTPTTEDPTPTTRRPRTTPTTDPPVTRAPSTAARAASTTRRSGGVASTGASTTFPTMPPSTATPELLVAGPVNAATGAADEKPSEGVSTSAALRWVIIGLVLVGLAIAGLTVAYWRHTRPGRAGDDEDDRDSSGAGLGGTGMGGASPGFTPLAGGGSADAYRPYRPPGQYAPPGSPGSPGAPGTGGSTPSPGTPGPGSVSWRTPDGGRRTWDPGPPVGAGEGYEGPWRSP